MKFKLQQHTIELTLQNHKSNNPRVLFSYADSPLNNARVYIKKNNHAHIYDLNKGGNIAILNDVQPNILLSLGSDKNKLTSHQYAEYLNTLIRYIQQNTAIAVLDIILEPQLAKLYPNLNTFIEQTIFHIVFNMYEFHQCKTQQSTLNLKQINFIIDKPTLQQNLNNAIALLDGIFLVKNLGNLPANIATPTYLADIATNIAKTSNKVEITILNKDKMKKLNMNCILAVSQGSVAEPKFIHLSYYGRNKKSPSIVLIGKGVTFDSGGLNLKGHVMEQMKYDMLGAATVLGIFQCVVALKLPINLTVMAPCTENLPSGNALKPGDIIKSMSGKTIEVNNTDAEGRLILCDALTYAQQLNAELIIDIATLTGACITALGRDISALYSNNESLSQLLKDASKRSNDHTWELPLFDKYNDKLKYSIADLINSTSWTGEAGSMIGGLFLAQFVTHNKWAHLDIAGVAWGSAQYNGSNNSGATGRPFNLLMDFLRNYNTSFEK